MANHIRVTPMTDELLTALSVKRKAEGKQIKSKQDIAAEAIINLHKKEVKNDRIK